MMRIKDWFRYVVFPTYRRSCLIIRYLREGYKAQEALAKVGVIEA